MPTDNIDTAYQDIRHDLTQCQTQLGLEPTDHCIFNYEISHL